MSEDVSTVERVEAILRTIKPLAAEYYRLTGKPLGVTGEIAEYLAATILGLELAAARTAGYDAIREVGGSVERIQIKGRALGARANPGQRLGRLKLDADCDVVMLVLMDSATLEANEIWEAPYATVVEVLTKPGSKARDRGQLGIGSFKAVAKKVWPINATCTPSAPPGIQRSCPE